MKKVALLAAAVSVFAVGNASAKIPLVNATCPTGIEVHADEGGPIYVNGKEGKLKRFNENYYEASHDGVVISLTINPDGSVDVSYTAKHGANGVCAIK